MSTIAQLGKDMKNLPTLLLMYRDKISDWKKDISLNGKNLEMANIEQPSLIAFYDQLCVEIHSILEYVEMREKEIRGARLKFIKENFQKEYNDTAIQRVIDADPEYIKIHQIYLEVRETYESCRSIVESFKQRGYSLNNIVKIRASQLEDITIRINE